jgi:hypothetical protein
MTLCVLKAAFRFAILKLGPFCNLVLIIPSKRIWSRFCAWKPFTSRQSCWVARSSSLAIARPSLRLGPLRPLARVVELLSQPTPLSLPHTRVAVSNLDLRILRPLSNLLSKEIALYNYFHQITPVRYDHISTGKPSNFSIDKLVADFITGLQQDFPSTMNTVARTASKIPTTHLASEKACLLCHCPLDTTATFTDYFKMPLFEHSDLQYCYACTMISQSFPPEQFKKFL